MIYTVGDMDKPCRHLITGVEFTLGPGYLSLKSSFKIFFSDFFLKFAIFNLEYQHFNFTIFWYFTIFF